MQPLVPVCFLHSKKGYQSDVQTHCLLFSCYGALLGCWWHIAWFIWEREISSLTICGRVWRRDILGNLGCWFALLDQITAPSAGIYKVCIVESISRHFYSLPYFALKIANVHLCHSICTLQWYPGHIAKTEKELKEQLRLMDVVIEIRDARIPLSTSHPKVIL